MSVIDYAAIGIRIRDIRLRKKISQEKLADMSDITVVHLSNIENAHTKLSLPTIVNIANALNVSVDELLSDSLSVFESTIDKELRDLVMDCKPYEKNFVIDVMEYLKLRMRTAIKESKEKR